MPEDTRTDEEIFQDLANYYIWLVTEKSDWLKENCK